MINSKFVDDYGNIKYVDSKFDWTIQIKSANWFDRLFFRDCKYKLVFLSPDRMAGYSTNFIMYYRLQSTLNDVIDKFEKMRKS